MREARAHRRRRGVVRASVRPPRVRRRRDGGKLRRKRVSRLSSLSAHPDLLADGTPRQQFGALDA